MITQKHNSKMSFLTTFKIEIFLYNCNQPHLSNLIYLFIFFLVSTFSSICSKNHTNLYEGLILKIIQDNIKKRKQKKDIFVEILK